MLYILRTCSQQSVVAAGILFFPFKLLFNTTPMREQEPNSPLSGEITARGAVVLQEAPGPRFEKKLMIGHSVPLFQLDAMLLVFISFYIWAKANTTLIQIPRANHSMSNIYSLGVLESTPTVFITRYFKPRGILFYTLYGRAQQECIP